MNEADLCGVVLCAFFGFMGYCVGSIGKALCKNETEEALESHWLAMKQMEAIYKARQEDREGRLLESVKAGAARLGLTNADADFIIAYAKQREATK